jgi:hypothetical protein
MDSDFTYPDCPSSPTEYSIDPSLMEQIKNIHCFIPFKKNLEEEQEEEELKDNKGISSCSFCKHDIQETSYFNRLSYKDKEIKYCCEQDCKGSQVLSILERLRRNKKNEIKERGNKRKRTLLATIKKGNSSRTSERYWKKRTVKFFDDNDSFIKIFDNLFKVDFLKETESLNSLLDKHRNLKINKEE